MLLFCAWLAWSRFRVVLPHLGPHRAVAAACLDGTLRAIGGAPTNALTDEKTVTVEHVARVRRPTGGQPRCLGHLDQPATNGTPSTRCQIP
jgi:hypothetical protein